MTLLEENVERIANSLEKIDSILQQAFEIISNAKDVKVLRGEFAIEEDQMYIVQQELALRAEQIEFEKLKLQKEKEEFLKNK